MLSVRWSTFYSPGDGSTVTYNIEKTSCTASIWYLNHKLSLSLWYLALGIFILVSLSIRGYWYASVYFHRIALRDLCLLFNYIYATVGGSPLSRTAKCLYNSWFSFVGYTTPIQESSIFIIFF